MKHGLAVILGLALAGCAPSIPVLVMTPGEPSATEPRPASEVMDDLAVTPRYGTGAIVITSKGNSWFTEGCTFDVALDDQHVAGVRPGEQLTLFAEPGQRVIGFRVRDEASCLPASTQVLLEIVEHTTQKIRVGADSRHELKVEVDSYGRSLPP